MTTPLTTAALRAGLISKATLEEFRRWGAPIDIPEGIPAKPPKTIEEAGQLIEEALQSEGYTIARETDLEVLHQYLSTQAHGTLHVEFFTSDPTQETEADIDVNYGVTPIGEFIIPWKSESIASELTNGACYLTSESLGGSKIFFMQVRELFFGEQKAFMVCTGRPVDQTKALTEGGSDDRNESS
jgi:hypothetical protein